MQVSETEQKQFSVYEADSSVDAARKLIQNLWLDEDLHMYWAMYIDERRMELDRQHINTLSNYSPPGHHANGNIRTFSNLKITI